MAIPLINDTIDVERTPENPVAGLVSISEEELPHYFVERSGRLFPAQSPLTYPLPVDEREHDTQAEVHNFVKSLTYGRCLHRLQILARRRPQLVPRVLDVGTGFGTWLTEMARQLPQVECYGVDIVPVIDSSAPHNVVVEVPDYEKLVSDATRALRPCGLLSISEWTRTIEMADGRDFRLHAPGAHAFLTTVEGLLSDVSGIKAVIPQINRALRGEPRLRRLITLTSPMYVGDWPQREQDKHEGTRFRYILIEYAKSMKVFLERYLAPSVVQELISGFTVDISTVAPLITTYYTVHAVRRA
ncbi:hypothetical protein NUW54_g2219 [Trametes sanguinea]|uniref:Uncharacterized protein n=1 Tax=Trametes sanguinea TaxID=158606 RepID=A0ACC1Q5Z2_9APHY|nr:hypothetical protein NUW54_g2219 [Trametes sanguinea]